MQERAADIRDQYQLLHEFIPAARRALPPDIWDYMIGAAETETTLKRNRLALDSLGFRPRVLRDVSNIDCSGRLFGRKSRIPVMLAPVGSIERFDAGGAATVARAAAAFGVPQMVSSVCSPDLEETAAASSAQKFYQLYVRGDEAWVEAMMERAARSRSSRLVASPSNATARPAPFISESSDAALPRSRAMTATPAPQPVSARTNTRPSTPVPPVKTTRKMRLAPQELLRRRIKRRLFCEADPRTQFDQAGQNIKNRN